ncbi:LysR family transcriptional regulator [Herbaspirillum rubrisubalbicans]|uniref:LysR family transcriptional regulator n=1 Tax=Herbaspirillum rubrisubalbicans TaxID=80842 RepID=UPI0015590DF9|nr:LysR family transcriptional regulator [Herbaspirillum rubrisubalbicans]NQE47841.1 LysR family transcriptional regulator [Herbaspirillum rubrisubalbicans]
MFDWQDLHFFLATARLGSFTAAAAELGVDHATVGRRVARLEASIERKLVVRLPRSTRLTKDGQALAGVAQAMEAQTNAIVRHLRGSPGGIQTTVTVSALPVLAAFLIAPSLPGFSQAHPEIHMVLSATSTVVSLERAEAEIAIGLVRPKLPGRVVRQVGELSLALYACHEYIVKPPEHWMFIGFESSLGDIPQQRWLNAFAAGRPFTLRSNDIVTQAQGARAGLGIALLPRLLADADPGLVHIKTHPVPLSRKLWMSVHADVRQSPAVRAVMEHLIEVCATLPGSVDSPP